MKHSDALSGTSFYIKLNIHNILIIKRKVANSLELLSLANLVSGWTGQNIST
jgi:hypothetical protein